MKWTKDRIAHLKDLVDHGYTDMEIAERLKTTYNSIEKARRRYFISKPSVKTLKRTVSMKQHFNTIANNIKQELSKATPYKNAVVPQGKGDTLVMHFTDWHMGKEIKNEYGEVIFNEDIARQRVDVLIGQALGLLDNHVSKGVPITDVVLCLTGDICDGMGIFASQESQSEMSPPFQVMLACEVIQKLILALLDRKLRVRVYGVKGNHGEIRENGKTKDPNANWDLMLYLILEFWIKTMKNKLVSIEYSELDYLNFEIRGWKYHMRHIAPQQSETSAGKAKFLGWARTHGFDALIYGHYHHWGAWDRSGIVVFRGGSLPGADEFSEKLSEESQPTQLMWGVSDKRPMTFMYAVDLGEHKK